MSDRAATVTRKTKETQVKVTLLVDGTGLHKISTSVPFLDHMLVLMSKHGFFDLEITATGDTEVDFHHTVEDVGICLGRAFREALNGYEGIARYGGSRVPMNEALAQVDVDLCGRAHLVYNADPGKNRVGEFDTELAREFFHSFSENAKATLHICLNYGTNAHHCIEAVFKALGRALDEATRPEPRIDGALSTKGTLS